MLLNFLLMSIVGGFYSFFFGKESKMYSKESLITQNIVGRCRYYCLTVEITDTIVKCRKGEHS